MEHGLPVMDHPALPVMDHPALPVLGITVPPYSMSPPCCTGTLSHAQSDGFDVTAKDWWDGVTDSRTGTEALRVRVLKPYGYGYG